MHKKGYSIHILEQSLKQIASIYFIGNTATRQYIIIGTYARRGDV